MIAMGVRSSCAASAMKAFCLLVAFLQPVEGTIDRSDKAQDLVGHPRLGEPLGYGLWPDPRSLRRGRHQRLQADLYDDHIDEEQDADEG